MESYGDVITPNLHSNSLKEGSESNYLSRTIRLTISYHQFRFLIVNNLLKNIYISYKKKRKCNIVKMKHFLL